MDFFFLKLISFNKSRMTYDIKIHFKNKVYWPAVHP